MLDRPWPPVWEIAVHLAVVRDVFIDVSLSCPFFPRDVLDEIWDLTGSISEDFPTFFCKPVSLEMNLCANL